MTVHTSIPEFLRMPLLTFMDCLDAILTVKRRAKQAALEKDE